MKRPTQHLPAATALAALALLLCAATPAAAGPPTSLFADGFSWNGFVNYWTGYVNNGNRVVQFVLIVLAVGLFIITRGKWR